MPVFFFFFFWRFGPIAYRAAFYIKGHGQPRTEKPTDARRTSAHTLNLHSVIVSYITIKLGRGELGHAENLHFVLMPCRTLGVCELDGQDQKGGKASDESLDMALTLVYSSRGRKSSLWNCFCLLLTAPGNMHWKRRNCMCSSQDPGIPSVWPWTSHFISLGPQFFKIWQGGDDNLRCTGLLEDQIIIKAATYCVFALMLRQLPSASCELSHLNLHKIPSEEGLVRRQFTEKFFIIGKVLWIYNMIMLHMVLRHIRSDLTLFLPYAGIISHS